jgi:hypothetical protein
MAKAVELDLALPSETPTAGNLLVGAPLACLLLRPASKDYIVIKEKEEVIVAGDCCQPQMKTNEDTKVNKKIC